MLSKKALAITPSPTMTIDSRARELRSRGVDVIGLSAGEPDFDTPPHIREAGIKAINEGHTRYTAASGTQELKEAICAKLKKENGLDYNPAQIVISNGGKHSVNNTLAALLNPGDEVMIPLPYWVSYPEMVKMNDGIPLPVASSEANNLKITPADLEKVCTAKTKALILNSPTNPTGQVYFEEELRKIADFCFHREVFIISDEIYEKLIYDGTRHISVASFNEKIKDLTIIVNGASKTYAMTGWRIGYTASSEEISGVMSAIQSQTAGNPSSIAQKAALAALEGPQDCVEEMRQAFDERRRYMHEKINSTGLLNSIEPRGTFYLFAGMAETVGKSYKGQKIEGSDDFASLLLENKKVAVVPGSGFGAPNHVRLSFATKMEYIEEGLERIEAFLNELE